MEYSHEFLVLNFFLVEILPFFIIYYTKYYKQENSKPIDVNETDDYKDKNMAKCSVKKSPHEEILNEEFSNEDTSGFNHISSSPVGVSKSKKRLSIPNFSDLLADLHYNKLDGPDQEASTSLWPLKFKVWTNNSFLAKAFSFLSSEGLFIGRNFTTKKTDFAYSRKFHAHF